MTLTEWVGRQLENLTRRASDCIGGATRAGRFQLVGATIRREEVPDVRPAIDTARDALRALRTAFADFATAYEAAAKAAPNGRGQLQGQFRRFHSEGEAPRRMDRELIAALRALHLWNADASRFDDAMAGAPGNDGGDTGGRSPRQRGRAAREDGARPGRGVDLNAGHR